MTKGGCNIGHHNMIIYAICILVCIGFVLGSDNYNQNVDFFDYCGNTVGYDKLVSDGKTLRVIVDEDSWYMNTLTCTVVFKSASLSSYLSYKFTSFVLNTFGYVIDIESKDTMPYVSEATYSYYNFPSIGISKLTNRFMKVTVKHKANWTLPREPISAVFEVYTDGFSAKSVMSGAEVSALVIGIIALVAIVIVIAVCYRRCQTKDTNRGLVVQQGNQPVATTVTSSSFGDQFSMYPVHRAAAHPGGYTAQPASRSPTEQQTSTYAEEPPSYEDVINGDYKMNT